MIIKQEIQAIQDSSYRFVAEHKRTAWLIICYKKDELSGFFKYMGDVMVISKKATGFKTLDAFKLIASKDIKRRLLSLACRYIDDRKKVG